MLERIDFLIKWYLRLVALIWILFVPTLYLITFISGSQETNLNIFLNAAFEWAFLVPFGYEQNVPGQSAPVIRLFFWSFWIITVSRWILSGRHFYQ